jgi:hypothetical protein
MTLKRNTIFQIGNSKVLDCYNNEDNYLIELNQNINNNNCVIYFSSNGLYYPNTEEAFTKIIIQKNRFEWINRNKVRDAKKNIFLRDILKQFYLLGINNKINSIEKMLNFLKGETEDMKITTVGGSGGGYAAVLFGILLNADRIFNFSGQFSLLPLLKERAEHYGLYPLLFEYQHDSRINKYYDLIELARNSKMPIFYFLPGNCNFDLVQKELVQEFRNIYIYMTLSRTHGTTVHDFCKSDILEMSSDAIIRRLSNFRDKKVSTLQFSLKVSGPIKTLRYYPKAEMQYLFQVLRFLLWYLPNYFLFDKKE